MRTVRMLLGGVLLLLLACGHEEEPIEEVEDLESPSITVPVTAWRPDAIGWVTPYHGNWGDWRSVKVCPEGSFVNGFTQRVEAPIDGDDTSLNSVSMECADLAGNRVATICPHGGFWGAWGQTAYCPTGRHRWFVGGDVLYERPQGSGDDTGANGVAMLCNDEVWANATNNGPWGEWAAGTGATRCPIGTAVCGLNLRIEGKKGSDDDTAMNGIALLCCTHP